MEAARDTGADGRRRILIDCDPGLDDAAAILMALGAADRLDLAAVTTVAGNVGLAAVTANARGLLALAGRSDVPVFAGCPRPLIGGVVDDSRAGHIHGGDGIGGVALPTPGGEAETEHAVAAILRIARAAPAGGLTLVATGPLTNLACALTMAPDIAGHVDRIVLMGGAAAVGGNVTPAAEFNVASDPHAARIVFEASIPITAMPLDVTRHAVLDAARIDAVRAVDTAPAHALADMLASYRGRTGKAVLHDPCTIAWLLAPALFSGATVPVAVDTESALSMGRLVVDWRGVSGRPANATVMTTLDAEGFYDLLVACLARL